MSYFTKEAVDCTKQGVLGADTKVQLRPIFISIENAEDFMHLLVTCYALYASSFSISDLRNDCISNTQYIHKAFVRMPKSFFRFNKTEQVKSQTAPPPLPH